MAIHVDRLDTGILRRTPNGYEQEVIAIVTGVGGDVWSRRLNAMTAPGLPLYGSAHPRIPEIRLLEMDAEPESGTTGKFVVRMVYRTPDTSADTPVEGAKYGPTRWSGGTVQFTEETFRDRNGDIMTAVQSRLVGLSVTLYTKVGRVELDRPALTMHAERWERDDPENTMAAVVGRLNSATFRRRAIETVRCENVRYRPADAGGYSVEYEFAYRPQGWQAEIAIEVDGQVPTWVVEGYGLKKYDVLDLYDFNRLRL